MVGEDGRLPLPWIGDTLVRAQALAAHALLLHAAAGAGSLETALTLAQSWLCEARGGAAPCGVCNGCRLVARRSHPDLMVLLPEELRAQYGGTETGAGDEADGGEGARGKRKPSRQIRIDEVRAAIDWVVTTASRGRGKVVVIHPSERMNPQAANALLKTLEEPPSGVRLVLTAADPTHLLPTVRSRCQQLRLDLPRVEVAAAWLEAQGVSNPGVLLAACSGRPLEALALAQGGVDAARWTGLPKALIGGRAADLAGWPLPRVIDTLQKLCHDAMAVAAGGQGRFFAAVPPARSLAALGELSRRLASEAATAEHPRNEALFVEALLAEVRVAWNRGPGPLVTLRP